MMKRIAILLLLGLFSIVGLAAFSYHELTKPNTLAEPLQVDVLYGDSIYKIANKLRDKKVISYPRVLIWYTRVFDKARLLKAGEYRIQPGSSALAILDDMISAKVVQYSVTFIEGWSTEQAILALQDSEGVVSTLDPNDHEAILRAVEADPAFVHSEGLFYPDTYNYIKGMKDRDILKQAYEKMMKAVDKAWHARGKNLPYKNPYDMLIMASIIEKETAVDDERRQVAGVFVQRLLKGMRLQTDPTVIYGMGKRYKGNIRRKDLREATPYNTYVIKGLPPSPIGLSTEASLMAAVNPLLNGKLYFVGKGDGYHYFSSTLAEHNKAVKKYQLTRRNNYRSTPKIPNAPKKK